MDDSLHGKLTANANGTIPPAEILPNWPTGTTPASVGDVGYS